MKEDKAEIWQTRKEESGNRISLLPDVMENVTTYSISIFWQKFKEIAFQIYLRTQ
jgi:hypothetical protein